MIGQIVFLHILAHFEAVIDFPDEDLPQEVEDGVRAKVHDLAKRD